MIAETLNSVLRQLGSARNSVSVIAVSVDPDRDTPAAVRAYRRVHRLLPGFHYLIGPRPALRQVWQNYNVLAMRRNEEVVDHSAFTLLIDRQGRPRVFYSANVRAPDLLHDIRVLLAVLPRRGA